MIVYDNDVNTYAEVIHILQVATACTREEAEIEAWEVDNLGKSVVHHGAKEERERAPELSGRSAFASRSPRSDYTGRQI